MNNKEPLDTQPMSFPPQSIITAFGNPKQLIILSTTGTIEDHRIPGIPAHSIFLPVGLFLVCSSAWLIIDDPIIYIF